MQTWISLVSVTIVPKKTVNKSFLQIKVLPTWEIWIPKSIPVEDPISSQSIQYLHLFHSNHCVHKIRAFLFFLQQRAYEHKCVFETAFFQKRLFPIMLIFI